MWSGFSTIFNLKHILKKVYEYCPHFDGLKRTRGSVVLEHHLCCAECPSFEPHSDLQLFIIINVLPVLDINLHITLKTFKISEV